VWLLVQDIGSYSPEKVEAVWKQPELASLKPRDGAGLRDQPNGNRIPVKTPSMLVYDIGGRRFTKLSGTAALENQEISSALNPRLRFLIFDEKPDLDQLSPITPGTPLAAPPVPTNAEQAVNQVFEYALGRRPTPAEARIAKDALEPLSPEALADVLWAVLAKPEFQLIY
jgi:hypothetical protein